MRSDARHREPYPQLTGGKAPRPPDQGTISGQIWPRGRGSPSARWAIGYCDGHVERDGGLESDADIERPQ